MAFRRQKVLLAALIGNFLLMVYLAVQQHSYISSSGNCVDRHEEIPEQQALLTLHDTANTITIIIRDFEMFDNAIAETIRDLHSNLNGIKVLIVGDKTPYPPLALQKNWNVQIVSLELNLAQNYSSYQLDHLLKTRYVLILPDAVRFTDWEHLRAATGILEKSNAWQAVTMGVGKEPLHCTSLDVDLKHWQMSIGDGKPSNDHCDAWMGDQALIMRSEIFRSLVDPFSRPFPFTFYIQAKLRHWKVHYLKTHQLDWVRQLFTDPHNKWKHKRLEEDRLTAFYKRAGIKAVVHPDNRTEYYGCTKTTPRCFGTIVDDMPEYLYEGKWTPPCCLKALRETTKHVFSILQEENVRYWLEGGSLLGAARNGDIIPWDYDVDIGIYKEDIEKSSYLKDAMQANFVDEQGFVWEKAPEGDFFRVQYSEHNRLHVDIHPFYSKDGTMTKDTWMKTHRQDTEFPEHYLKPLTKIPFAGVVASAPNNVREFLEFKFGAGVIEQPRFPNLHKAQ